MKTDNDFDTMTSEEFNAFLKHMDWSALKASQHLGLHYNTVKNYTRGYRLESPELPIEIPRIVYLACAALTRGVR